jgi:hypothetical protein
MGWRDFHFHDPIGDWRDAVEWWQFKQGSLSFPSDRPCPSRFESMANTVLTIAPSYSPCDFIIDHPLTTIHATLGRDVFDDYAIIDSVASYCFSHVNWTMATYETVGNCRIPLANRIPKLVEWPISYAGNHDYQMNWFTVPIYHNLTGETHTGFPELHYKQSGLDFPRVIYGHDFRKQPNVSTGINSATTGATPILLDFQTKNWQTWGAMAQGTKIVDKTMQLGLPGVQVPLWFHAPFDWFDPCGTVTPATGVIASKRIPSNTPFTYLGDRAPFWEIGLHFKLRMDIFMNVNVKILITSEGIRYFH